MHRAVYLADTDIKRQTARDMRIEFMVPGILLRHVSILQ